MARTKAKKQAGTGFITDVARYLYGNGTHYEIYDKLGAHPLSLPQPRRGSWRLDERLYLEQAEKFDWPDLEAAEQDTRFCLALRDQAAVLVDGTVVPCCLDHEGDIPLGNIFDTPMEEILAAPRARALYDGFSRGKPSEALCRRCGFARRFG